RAEVYLIVMPGLVPGIHVFFSVVRDKTWMRGTSPRMTATLRHPDIVEEAAHFGAQRLGLLVELDGGLHHLGGGGAARLHAAADAMRVRRHVGGGVGDLVGVGGDFLGRRVLVFHRAGHGGGNLAHLADRVA